MKASTTEKLFSGSYLQIVSNIIQRAVGVVSTLLLARLLTPEDFGLVAIIFLTINLAEVLTETGLQPYVVHKTVVDKQDVNSAWTLNLIFKLLATSTVIVTAPFVSEYMKNPEVILPIQVVAITIIFKALKNPGIALMIKNLEYKPIVKLAVTQKLISFLIVMICAFMGLGYWSLVYGDIVAALSILVGSYHVSKYRPKMSSVRIRQQLAFTRWSFLRGFVGYIRSQIDLILITRASPIRDLGGYHLQRELALMPAVSLVIPAIEPFLAVVSDARREVDAFGYRIRVSIIGLLAVILPISVFIFLESLWIVSVILGDKWVSYHHLLSIFAFMFFSFCLHALISDLFIAAERIKMLFFLDAFSLCVLLPSLLLIEPGDMGYEIALARGIIGLLITMSTAVLLARITAFGLLKLIRNIVPSLVALVSAVMVFQAALPSTEFIDHGLLRLVVKTITFFTIYVFFYLSLSLIFKKLMFENYMVCRAFWLQSIRLLGVK
ncbi:MAG: oligosaccharide flippase family protein [Pseudomonadota bacterium]|nr:oligosaccharide flippase family protein [Pseudomonadota bacterium]